MGKGKRTHTAPASFARRTGILDMPSDCVNNGAGFTRRAVPPTAKALALSRDIFGGQAGATASEPAFRSDQLARDATLQAGEGDGQRLGSSLTGAAHLHEGQVNWEEVCR